MLPILYWLVNYLSPANNTHEICTLCVPQTKESIIVVKVSAFSNTNMRFKINAAFTKYS